MTSFAGHGTCVSRVLLFICFCFVCLLLFLCENRELIVYSSHEDSSEVQVQSDHLNDSCVGLSRTRLFMSELSDA